MGEAVLGSGLRDLGVRLLYLPNEGRRNGRQEEGRAGFAELLERGELEGYSVFSFWDAYEASGDITRTEEELLKAAKECAATVVLWQHPGDFPVSTRIVERLKVLPSRPVVVYDERDLYYGRRKPLPRGGRTLARAADIVFSAALGAQLDSFPPVVRSRIRYSPTCIQKDCFAGSVDGDARGGSAVTMIASVDRHALPLVSLPGTRDRVRLAKLLFERFGARFRVFGSGWGRKPYSAGWLQFEQQYQAIRESAVTVAWDRGPKHWGYFSDRLPISMLSGIPHVTNTKPGFEMLFRNGVDLVYGSTPREVADLAVYVASLTSEERSKLGSQQREYCLNHLTSVPVFRRVLTVAAEHRRGIFNG